MASNNTGLSTAGAKARLMQELKSLNKEKWCEIEVGV